MEIKTFGITGMRCEHCKANIEHAIKSLDGVQTVHANLADNNVEVEFDNDKLSPVDIKNAVEDCGNYEVEV